MTDTGIDQMNTQGPAESKPEWSKWRRTSSYIPRRSINGKWIIGPMYKRGKWIDGHTVGDFSGHTFSKPQRVRQYISKRELFVWRLANSGQ